MSHHFPVAEQHTAQHWRAAALCAETDPEAFFPEPGEQPFAAKAICARCDVADECLEYALEHRVPYGIWGGLSTEERKIRLRVARATAAGDAA